MGGHLAVVIGELDGEVDVKLGELGHAGLAVEFLLLCEREGHKEGAVWGW